MQTHVKEGIETFLEQTAVVWKTALGSAIVWELARLTGSKHPYLAPLTFILCLQATVGQSLRYAMYRSVGTVIGVVMIGVFAKSIPVTAWALAVALLLSTALMKAFRANDLLIHQVALSILFVLYFENHSQGYAWDRTKDTLIGAVVGVISVLFLFPPNLLKKVKQALHTFVQHFVDTVNLVADGLEQGLLHSSKNPQLQLNALLDDADQMTESLKKVKQGSLFNLYTRKTEVDKVTQQCHRVRDACIHFVTLTRSMTEDMTQAERVMWSNRIRSLASEIPAFVATDSTVDDERKHASASTRHSTVFEPRVSEHELTAILDALRGFLRRTKG
ncbi:FUSC family protein [Alicyclobacillus tolerans]|uniref:FUSC family protein n=1 Tax=Alicyclobacillus tolerans TaxID=90970 RepID=UPI001F35D7BB|nr:FUSC family protein [Alicyclobacillus tolerans]MCF8567494.1 FUSC family protein [Alicyclobacillus tolerans]